MKSGTYFLLSTSPSIQPARKLRRTASFALRQCRLYGRLRRNIAGKELDPETGLYYFGARYLDPKTSRWISGVFNYVNLHVYHYAGNNPVKYTDPDGETINWEKEENVTDREFERVQIAAEVLMNSKTEAGRRFRELHEKQDVTVNIIITKESDPSSGPAYAIPHNMDSAGNGDGSGSDIYISAQVPLINPNKIFGVRLAHEVSWHAYDFPNDPMLQRTPLELYNKRTNSWYDWHRQWR